MAQALQAHVQAGRVHHHEHGSQALVGLAHQPGLRALEAHGAGGAALDAHLLFDAIAVDGVGQKAAVVPGNAARRQEQRQAARSLRRIGQARQHQVDDVLAHVLVAARDEDLAAVQAVAAIAPGPGLAAQQAQVGAGLGLGQAHGGQPAAADDVGQVGGAQVLVAMRVQAGIGAVQDARIHGPAMVGRGQHFVQRGVQQLGQALAASVGGAGQCGPACLHEGCIGGGKAVGRAHPALLQAAALQVGRAVERGQHVGAKAPGRLDHHIGRLLVQGFMGRHAAPVALGAQPVLLDEADVLQRRLVVRAM